MHGGVSNVSTFYVKGAPGCTTENAKSELRCDVRSHSEPLPRAEGLRGERRAG